MVATQVIVTKNWRMFSWFLVKSDKLQDNVALDK